jgi:hypothetical protein
MIRSSAAANKPASAAARIAAPKKVLETVTLKALVDGARRLRSVARENGVFAGRPESSAIEPTR